MGLGNSLGNLSRKIFPREVGRKDLKLLGPYKKAKERLEEMVYPQETFYTGKRGCLSPDGRITEILIKQKVLIPISTGAFFKKNSSLGGLVIPDNFLATDKKPLVFIGESDEAGKVLLVQGVDPSGKLSKISNKHYRKLKLKNEETYFVRLGTSKKDSNKEVFLGLVPKMGLHTITSMDVWLVTIDKNR